MNPSTTAPLANHIHSPVADPCAIPTGRDGAELPPGTTDLPGVPHLFPGQAPTAKNLLAALDAQADPIAIPRIHFITPQSEHDDAPGTLERTLGIASVNQKRYGKAILHLERAIELGMNDYTCQMNLGLAYTRVGRLEEATTLLGDLRKMHPHDAGVATLLGKSLLLSGHRQEAIAVMGPVALTHPDRFHLHYYLGIAHAKLGQFEQAVRAWRTAANLRPDHKEIKAWLAKAEQ
ncbi:MAG: tetratricopeptide repeat protein [Magnetococcales bacterium]|nr:tetratricopeptide repeat protein [Magnetococcales bacterium]